jgi:hypothetical protein
MRTLETKVGKSELPCKMEGNSDTHYDVDNLEDATLSGISQTHNDKL